MSPRRSRLFRLALLAVPATWRESVRDDLEEEADRTFWGSMWCAVEACGIAISLHWVFTRASVMSDIRYTLRSLNRARGFSTGAILTFALGIGVNLAVFSAVDRMLFRPLPYAHPDQLVVMGNYRVGDSRPYGTIAETYLVQARQLPAVADASISEWNADGYRLTENPDAAHYFRFVRVSYTTLRTLGLHPVIGQDFTEDDARAERRRLLVSYAVWQREFGGRADVVGRRIWGSTAGQLGEIVGVLPQDFIPPQISLPTLDWSGIAVDEETLDVAGPRSATTPPILRLKPGVTLEAARSQIATIDARIRASMPAPPPGVPPSVVRLVPLREALFGRYETYVALVFAAATMVLLVGCANLASLLLVRARSREHRAALQLALGASPSRIIRAAVIEALLLALAGFVVAVVVLKASDRVIAAWLPLLFSRYASPVLSLRVLLFTAVLATSSALVAGILPGWRTARVDVLSILQRGGGRIGAGPLRGSATILAAEIAVSLVLVACATLAGRDLVGLLRTDVGYDPNRLFDIVAFLPPPNDLVARRQQYAEMLDVVRAIPGVETAAGANVLPVIPAIEGPMWDGDGGRGRRWPITEGLVEALGMRVIAGRTISAAEVQGQAPVGMLSESGLRLVWPGVHPNEAIGRFLRFPGEGPRQVIGIVSDVRTAYAEAPNPSLYVPSGPEKFRFMEFGVRFAPGASLTVSELTRRLNERGFQPQRVSISRLSDRLEAGVVDPKFRAELLSAFGVVALVLATIGLYAVQSFSVALRTSEFGVRLSLGATPRDLWRMLTRQMLRPVVAGLALGALATWWVAQFLQAFLTGVDARDPWTYASVAFALLLVAAIATLVPARRASRTDPSVVLRAQ